MVHLAERKTGKGPKKTVKVPGVRTERERSGKARAGYVPQSRSYASNLKRKLRRKPGVGTTSRATSAGARMDEEYDAAHRLARRGVRSTRLKRTSVYDQSQSYYRRSRGSPAGGFIEGKLGETTPRARRGGHGDQDRRTKSLANVKNKRSGRGPRRLRQSDQGDAGQ